MKTYHTLITGASQGLGKAMALEFAGRNLNLVLIALPESGLIELSEFIKNNFHIDVHSLEMDLSNLENCYKIAEYINNQKIHVRYLVNNAGILSRGLFEDLDDMYILKQIEVNITTPTLLIKLLLNNLKKSAPSAILNVSSMAAFFPLQKKQVYGGTKAYLLSFSKSLRKELKKDNISVTTLCPGGLNTSTRMCYQNRLLGLIPRHSTLDPEVAATIAINAMMKRKNIIIPGFINNCFMVLDKLLPEFVKDLLTKKEIKEFSTS